MATGPGCPGWVASGAAARARALRPAASASLHAACTQPYRWWARSAIASAPRGCAGAALPPSCRKQRKLDCAWPWAAPRARGTSSIRWQSGRRRRQRSGRGKSGSRRRWRQRRSVRAVLRAIAARRAARLPAACLTPSSRRCLAHRQRVLRMLGNRGHWLRSSRLLPRNRGSRRVSLPPRPKRQQEAVAPLPSAARESIHARLAARRLQGYWGPDQTAANLAVAPLAPPAPALQLVRRRRRLV